MKPRVLLIAGEIGPGAARAAHALAAALGRVCDARLVTESDSRRARWLALADPWFGRKVWREYGKCLETGVFDVVHLLTPRSPAAPGFLAKKLARIDVPYVVGPLSGRPAATTRRLATALVAATRRACQEVCAGEPALEAKTVWLPAEAFDPADGFLYHPEPPARGNTLHVAFVGDLVPAAGADLLIEAAAPLLRDGRMKLDIIGEGPQMAELRSVVLQEGVADAVVFSGRLPRGELRSQLSESTVLAYPGGRGPDGGVMLEAMALGLAPMVLDGGGPADLVPDGCGLVLPAACRKVIVTGFRNALEKLSENPEAAHEMGARARRLVRTHLTWEARAEQWLRVYQWVLGGGSERKPDPFRDTRPLVTSARRTTAAAGH